MDHVCVFTHLFSRDVFPANHARDDERHMTREHDDSVCLITWNLLNMWHDCSEPHFAAAFQNISTQLWNICIKLPIPTLVTYYNFPSQYAHFKLLLQYFNISHLATLLRALSNSPRWEIRCAGTPFSNGLSPPSIAGHGSSESAVVQKTGNSLREAQQSRLWEGRGQGGVRWRWDFLTRCLDSHQMCEYVISFKTIPSLYVVALYSSMDPSLKTSDPMRKDR